MVKAMLHSLDRDGTHRANLVEVKILEETGNNDYIVLTPDGTKCHALYNPFTDYFFFVWISDYILIFIIFFSFFFRIVYRVFII